MRCKILWLEPATSWRENVKQRAKSAQTGAMDPVELWREAVADPCALERRIAAADVLAEFWAESVKFPIVVMGCSASQAVTQGR